MDAQNTLSPSTVKRFTKKKSTFNKILPVLFGETLEVYDFCLYGILSPVFAKIFFPPGLYKYAFQ